MGTKYSKNPQIIDRQESSGECYLFDPITARFRRLNQVGGDIWMLLEDNQEVPQIADAMLKRYKGVEREKLCADIESLLERLAANQLVYKSS
jgi:hypothetical protein